MKSFFKYLTSLLPALALVCMLFTQSGCSSAPENSTPESATRGFYMAFREMNFSKAKKYATHASASLIDIMSTLGKKAPNTLTTDPKAEFSLKTLSESDSTATVQVVLPDNTKAIVMQLIKENGAWKVAFDKSLD